MLKKPKAPSKPKAPPKTKTKTVSFSKSLYVSSGSTLTVKDIQDLLNLTRTSLEKAGIFNVDYSKAKFIVNSVGYYNSNINFGGVTVQLENPAYLAYEHGKALEEYNHKLEVYKLELIEYEKAKIEQEKKNIEKQIAFLQLSLNKLNKTEE